VLGWGERSAWRPVRFTSGGRAPGTHRIGGYVGLKAGRGSVGKRRISLPCRKYNPYSLHVHSVAHRYVNQLLCCCICCVCIYIYIYMYVCMYVCMYMLYMGYRICTLTVVFWTTKLKIIENIILVILHDQISRSFREHYTAGNCVSDLVFICWYFPFSGFNWSSLPRWGRKECLTAEELLGYSLQMFYLNNE
jgi:hypothetical protein